MLINALSEHGAFQQDGRPIATQGQCCFFLCVGVWGGGRGAAAGRRDSAYPDLSCLPLGGFTVLWVITPFCWRCASLAWLAMFPGGLPAGR